MGEHRYPLFPQQSAAMERAYNEIVERSRVLSFAVHGDAGNGDIDVEFRTVRLAMIFMEENRISAAADIRKGDSVKSFTDPVVITFNLYDYAKRNNLV